MRKTTTTRKQIKTKEDIKKKKKKKGGGGGGGGGQIPKIWKNASLRKESNTSHMSRSTTNIASYYRSPASGDIRCIRRRKKEEEKGKKKPTTTTTAATARRKRCRRRTKAIIIIVMRISRQIHRSQLRKFKPRPRLELVPQRRPEASHCARCGDAVTARPLVAL